ncbi:unnamed protein product [Parnassius apollo]|uniref:(apollo) hypothetical protein n=1 Tax=Parnassius apollo TaxID=110799 RepID=A0A8S3WVI8_PARAO|nr:unnamed protein product [Parnassius apollo]
MAPSRGETPSLPVSAEEVKDLVSFSVINKLTSCVGAAINEGKSVTAVNKRLISLAMEEIRRATRTLNSVNTTVFSSTSALGEIKACNREEMASFKKLVNTNVKKPTYARAAAAASGVASSTRGPAPRAASSTSKPAIIITPAKGVKTRQEAVELFKKCISYRDSTNAPARVQPVPNNKLRVEFEKATQRDDTLTRLENSKEVRAEPVRMIKPMVILKERSISPRMFLRRIWLS